MQWRTSSILVFIAAEYIYIQGPASRALPCPCPTLPVPALPTSNPALPCPPIPSPQQFDSSNFTSLLFCFSSLTIPIAADWCDNGPVESFEICPPLYSTSALPIPPSDSGQDDSSVLLSKDCIDE
uniref:Uncharacterized protein n=1 Tax=Onchocerca volvulus TaxID=6282 RepID=A0A8R1Y071_ONCVO